MRVLKDLCMSKLVNLYEGKVVEDRKILIAWDAHRGTPTYELHQRTYEQDKMILGALKCARAAGYTGEV